MAFLRKPKFVDIHVLRDILSLELGHQSYRGLACECSTRLTKERLTVTPLREPWSAEHESFDGHCRYFLCLTRFTGTLYLVRCRKTKAETFQTEK